jgi:putative phosphoesterase
MVKLGVIADTHVPDKTRYLNPKALSVFENAGVEAILHAGDVSVPRVIDELRQVAPVHAVRGNRDWMRLKQLPRKMSLTFDGITIGLTHGHGRMWDYLVDKYLFLTGGYDFERYRRVVEAIFPQALVIIFGHSHIPENVWVDGKLYFNPGTASLYENDLPPSVGLLQVHAGGKVNGELVPLG